MNVTSAQDARRQGIYDTRGWDKKEKVTITREKAEAKRR